MPAVMVTTPSAQSASPLQVLNAHEAAAVGTRVTTVPAKYRSEQSVPQSMPIGLEVTAPEPVRLTVSS
jgi:hypothetical protein